MNTISDLRKALGLSTTNQVRNRIEAIKDILSEYLRRGPNNQILITDDGVALLRRLQDLYDSGLTITEASDVLHSNAAKKPLINDTGHRRGGKGYGRIFNMGLNLPLHGNERLQQVVERVDRSARLTTLWGASNVTAIDRMHINDHGPVHIKIVTNIALKLLRLLNEGGVVSSVVANYQMNPEDAEVVVCLASVLHDIGHVIHRQRGDPARDLRPPPRYSATDSGSRSSEDCRCAGHGVGPGTYPV
jgi:hypothetical protein